MPRTEGQAGGALGKHKGDRINLHKWDLGAGCVLGRVQEAAQKGKFNKGKFLH